jgi:hypothetical protein
VAVAVKMKLVLLVHPQQKQVEEGWAAREGRPDKFAPDRTFLWCVVGESAVEVNKEGL